MPPHWWQLSETDPGLETVIVAPKEPTVAGFAAAVAKEVAKDLIPKPVLIIGGILLVLLLLWLLLG